MSKYNIFILLLVVSLSGCVKKESTFFIKDPALGEGAIVYIYRPDSSSNIVISPDVLIDSEKKNKIENKTYMSVSLPPGEHAFNLDLSSRYDGKHSIDLVLNDGQVYFLRIDTKMKFKMNDLYERSFDIRNISAGVALSEINECKDMDEKIRRNAKASQRKTKLSESSENKEPEKENASILEDDPDSQFSTSKTRNPFSR